MSRSRALPPGLIREPSAYAKTRCPRYVRLDGCLSEQPRQPKRGRGHARRTPYGRLARQLFGFGFRLGGTCNGVLSGFVRATQAAVDFGDQVLAKIFRDDAGRG